MINFEYPYVFIIPIIIYICQKYCKKNNQAIYLPNARYYNVDKKNKINLLNIFKWLTILFIIIAISSPYDKIKNPEQKYGVSILINLDVSGSMSSIFNDVKNSAIEFVGSRKNDNIGLVLFAGGVMVASPMTTELNYIKTMLKNINIGIIYSGGTAIYDTLATSNKILQKQESASKIIILFTDGEDFDSKYTQDEIYQLFEIDNYRVYSIVAGAKNIFLDNISKQTNGKYYNLEDSKNISDIYKQINMLEQELIDTDTQTLKTYYFHYFIWLSFITLFGYILLRYKVLKS